MRKRNEEKLSGCGAGGILSIMSHLFDLARVKMTNFTTAADASGKEPSGLREGAVHWIGNFDECFANVPPSASYLPKPPGSHYCQVLVTPPQIQVGALIALTLLACL